MAEPIKIRASIQGDAGDLRILCGHAMESGQRKDESGQPIPAHYIQTLDIQVNGTTLLSGQLGPAVSRNPLFQFRIKGAKAGDKVRVSWTDSNGDKRSDESTFAAG